MVDETFVLRKFQPTGFNQPEVDSWEQKYWRRERDLIYQSLKEWCHDNHIDFLCGYGYAMGNLTDFVGRKTNKILFAQLFDMLPSLSLWRQLDIHCQHHGQKFFVITDNHVTYPNLSHIYFFPVKEYLGSMALYGNKYLDRGAQVRRFNCFIQRVDSIRQSWLYLLEHNGLLDQGWVSFLLKRHSNDSKLTGQDLFDLIHTQYQLDQIPHFHESYLRLRGRVPLRNFQEIHDLAELIVQTKYSLILETFAVEDSGENYCWTEKSLRDLQLPVLSLPFWQRRSASILKNFGFEIPQYMLDFDDDDWQQRQQKILSILKNDSLELDPNECLQRAQHNRNLLASWQRSYKSNGFLDTIFEQISSC